MEKAKGPAGIGQNNPELLSGAGRGDGGRNVEQKYEMLLRTLKVNISVVENKVAAGVQSSLAGTQYRGRERRTQVRAAVSSSLYDLRRITKQSEV